ncbi:UDP-N-acetylmuramoyl-L-alanyl-D-glutamate--2,6-diaminopimelate ligase [Pseudonocardia spinosispora]|uniref:UDP-N-acetylmuramoyl-L-alanyl-D-glutamate--2, 6-diaminopimelate ligase n=1 Tax=Pseudonocardia spinosispora TaxID=103441 RepID=UPI00048B73C0|nr:UDP-N-acetylmuramoyl-L-alanyl-D-glutamate--2,6-diaminopimelate ligase [Pseudonocardia spinosispora]
MSPSPIATAHTASPRPEAIKPTRLVELAALIGAPSVEGAVTGVTLRTQDVRSGDLFAALPGARVHGADYAAQAVASGASAVLTDSDGATRESTRSAGVPVLVAEDPRSVLGLLAARVYGDPTSRLGVLGVTGTSGKTTVTFLIEAALRAAGVTSGLIGTVRSTIAGERWGSSLTTPEAPDLQALFAIMLERGVSHAAMEVSSHALAQHRVDGTRFAVGAFTNLSQDHLDYHHDMQSYFEAKALLFDGRASVEVINADDEWARRLLSEDKPGQVTVSAAGRVDAGWRAEGVRVSADGTQRFTAIDPSGARTPIMLPLPGAFNVANAMLALACLDQVGVPAAVAARGLAEAAVPGRLERVDVGQPYLALVDYAHKPGAVAALLDTLRVRLNGAGRLLVVLGCGGDRDAGKRPLMGAEAASRADLLVITDDNPRSEKPSAIRAAMRVGALAAPPIGEVLEIGDRRDAIAAAVARAAPGDVLVVAGKGHETGQEVDGVVRPFSDVEELRIAIQAREGDR